MRLAFRILLIISALAVLATARRRGKPLDLSKIIVEDTVGDKDQKKPKEARKENEIEILWPLSEKMDIENLMTNLMSLSPVISAQVEHFFKVGDAKETAGEREDEESAESKLLIDDILMVGLQQGLTNGTLINNIENFVDWQVQLFLNSSSSNISLPPKATKPLDFVCQQKVDLIEETLLEESYLCNTIFEKECFPSHKTSMEPKQLQECETRFKKVCYYEYREVSKERDVEVCNKQKIRNCKKKGKDVCTTEYEMICETLPAKKPSSHDREGRAIGTLPQQPPAAVEIPVNCTGPSEEHCQYDEDGDPFLCIRYPQEMCPSDVAKMTQQPETHCKQVEKRVCGPETCPVEERDFHCSKERKTVTQEIPVESCVMEPQNHCKWVTKLVPGLVIEERCEEVPKEICETVRLPKKVKRPMVQDWCGFQDRDILLTISGCDPSGEDLNVVESVLLKKRPEFHVFINSSQFGDRKHSTVVLDNGGHPIMPTQLPQFPFSTSGAVGGLMFSGPVVCGGNLLKSLCLAYDISSSSWRLAAEMELPRLFAAATMAPKADCMVITGGLTTDKTLTNTTEIILGGSSRTKQGPNLPEPLMGHCQVALNDSSIMIIGGLNSSCNATSRVYILNVETGARKDLPDMLVGRMAHACARIVSKDEVVVVGGLTTTTNVFPVTEIFSFKNMSWCLGPELPSISRIYGASGLEFNGTMLVVGGYESDAIYELSLEHMEWVRRRERLSSPRSSMVAMMAPKALYAGLKNMVGPIYPAVQNPSPFPSSSTSFPPSSTPFPPSSTPFPPIQSSSVPPVYSLPGPPGPAGLQAPTGPLRPNGEAGSTEGLPVGQKGDVGSTLQNEQNGNPRQKGSQGNDGVNGTGPERVIGPIVPNGSKGEPGATVVRAQGVPGIPGKKGEMGVTDDIGKQRRRSIPQERGELGNF